MSAVNTMPTVQAWRIQIMRRVVVPTMILLGLATLLGVQLTGEQAWSGGLLALCAGATGLPLVGLFEGGLPYQLKVALVAGGPILLGALIQTQQGPVLVPAVLLISGAGVLTTLVSLRAGIIALGLGCLTWLGIGALHAQGHLTPHWLHLVDINRPAAWIWNGTLSSILMISSVLMIAIYTRQLSEAIQHEQALHADITEEMSQQARAEQANAEAEAAIARTRDTEALGRLASGVAHDFNNALMVILATADPEQGLVLSEDEARAADELRAHARRAAALNRQLLAFSRPVQPRTRSLNLNEVLQEGLTFVQPLLPQSITLHTHLAEETPPVLGEPTHISQLLLTSVLQARDRLPQGGAFIIETERLSQDRAALRFIIEGGDHRPEGLFGLAPEDPRPPDLAALEPIIERLGGQLTPLPTHDQARVGLGLILAGTQPRKTTAPVLMVPRATPLKVLVAEDEAPVRRLMARYLAEAGITVLEADDGQEALEIFQRTPKAIDLVCTDGRMPRLDGPGLVEAVREVRPEVPILVCSAFVEDDHLQARLDQEDVCFLAKPFERITLINEIHRLITRSTSS